MLIDAKTYNSYNNNLSCKKMCRWDDSFLYMHTLTIIILTIDNFPSLPNGTAVKKLLVFKKAIISVHKTVIQRHLSMEAWRQSWRLIGQVDLFAAKHCNCEVGNKLDRRSSNSLRRQQNKFVNLTWISAEMATGGKKNCNNYFEIKKCDGKFTAGNKWKIKSN